MSFWAITTFFNPAGYKALVNNHALFSHNLRRQGVKLLTIEVAFGNDPFYLEGVEQIRSKDCMWLKERLINYGMSILPNDCDKFAWLDCDLLLPDGWNSSVISALDKCDVIQLFRRIYYLPPGHTEYRGEQQHAFDGIIAQRAKNRNWLVRRENKDLPFAAPGFAWAARRDFGGVYDWDIVGSGDCIFVDSLVDSWALHGYERKFSERMKQHIQSWASEFKKKRINVDYLPVDLFHLWHGDLRNRGYMKRHEILLSCDYDPDKDVKLVGPVFEWSSDKLDMHRGIKDYFNTRLEDTR